MRQARSGKCTLRGIWIWSVAVLLAVSTGAGARRVYGQSISPDTRTNRGATLVSVATLQVPEQAWKHYEKARVLAQKHQTADSERECEKALAIAPSFPAAHMLEASIQLYLKEYSAAVLSVAAARKGDAHVEWAGIILAGAFNGLRRYEDAMTEVQSLRGDEASSWQAKYEQTRAATGLGDQEEALRLSMELQQVEPKDFPDSILVRANAQLLAHRWSEAAADLTAYLALPGQQTHQDEVRTALVDVTRRMHAVETVNLASK